MDLTEKPFDDIVEEDLQALIRDEISENKRLEYKAELSLLTDKAKKEFLADISSFANANGGDIYIGIIEDKEKGMPIEIRGIRLGNPDEEILRLENLVRDGISPRLGGLKIRYMKMSSENFIIIIRIPPSWMNPHRVTLKGHDKFYSRNSAGKYPLDVDELRNTFNLADTTRNNIGKFKNNRIISIQLDETPIPVYELSKTILHIIPLVSINRPMNIDIRSLVNSQELRNKMRPMGTSLLEERYNIDGYLAYATKSDYGAFSYFQFYRNGIIEAVEGRWLRSKDIPVASLEKGIQESVTDYLKILSALAVPTPIYLFLTLLGVKDHRIPYKANWLNDLEPPPIGRDVLQLPEIIIEEYPTKIDALLKPTFDTLWNAGGYSKDPYYAEDGTWNGPR